MSKKLSQWWTRGGVWLLTVLFIAILSTLSVLKHDSFHTRALDLAKFDQAIWNTLQGRFLFSTIQNQSTLGNHFSPLMAFLSPLFLIWNDIRLLFLVQTIGLAIAGLFLYKIVRTKHPHLAPWFLLAYYLNPALHEVALVEFRRVTLAVPFLALALYALYAGKRRWLVVGLAFALLCKENIGLIVFMFGIYLILFERDWKYGTPLALVGITWAVGITFWVIPMFLPRGDEGNALYPQLKVFCLEGESYGAIVSSVLREPQVFFLRMFDRQALQALWRIFFPVGLVLPFLAFDWLLIVLPSIAYMLMSCAQGMHTLQDWYMASVLPGLFAAVAVALTRLSERKARWATFWLLLATAVGYVLYSHAPPGAKYEPELYKVNAHHRLAAQVVDTIPADARVAAQDPYVPHLSHREQIYLFPWVPDLGEIDYFLLDRHLHPFPLPPDELNDFIDEFSSNTSLVLEMEGDGIFLFHLGGEPLPTLSMDAVAGETMLLNRVEVAVLQGDGFFHVVTQEPIEVRLGQTVRASLYWEALDAPLVDRTVSIRIVDATGAFTAQSDNMPGFGKKPTSGWQPGFQMRDVHYLTISAQSQPGPGSLEVVVYDSFRSEVLPFDGGEEILHVADVVLIP